MQHRAETHDTGLQGHDQFAAGKAVVADRCRRFPQRHYLRMSGRIMIRYRTVVTAADDFSPPDHDRTYRYLALFFG